MLNSLSLDYLPIIYFAFLALTRDNFPRFQGDIIYDKDLNGTCIRMSCLAIILSQMILLDYCQLVVSLTDNLTSKSQFV